MTLINIRRGVERLAFVVAAICILIGALILLNSISDGYWSDAKIGLYFSLYSSIIFIYGSQVFLWVLYGFAGQEFKFKINPLCLLNITTSNHNST
ncbi:hypothetical protein ONP73_24930 [Salmonella enterica subsp. enterica serovar Lille]|uniref:Uncharacterized protein n=1 Tax=Salmonella enterica TaxID=28901 RepID=A0A5Y2QES0_SALER|nr:hypothetical protein [Salmonella enterica]EBF3224846.1 hypothetical protein [Salmonella enterica subsp. enterica serovar Derby]ECD3616488.1 hypothetical protein [Salmonella enterica subsp. enterica serovar Oranienburg]ECD6690535.1 hypothetical protein [Salmonella enterica subsp. enterica serovar Eastbourne]EDH9392773.1 hypothetical protein [Salmonella enterica subsp. enterica serovar Muenster]EDQ6197993.1 hypothetical protein [Salmonella enterica subsp. enterica serovar Sandiego]EDT6079048